MPANRNALIRFKTIDKCLQNRFRRWTLTDLIDACSDALYEYEGIDKGVSKRSVQADIQMMRSDKLGYNAPIIVVDRKYYTYEDPDYSITNIPITNQDLEQLNEAIAFLKQFKGFSHFKELDGMVQKLEDHVYSKKENKKPVIHFEKNEHLKGLSFLDNLYQAIVKKQVLEITYQSFKAKTANAFAFHAYLLKEYNNRWFLLGVKGKNSDILTLALDRIQNIEILPKIKYLENKILDPVTYYKDVIGVTVSKSQAPAKLKLFVFNRNAPYILTKPMHPSQQLVEELEDGIIIELKVQFNFELERVILGYGPDLIVLEPKRFRNRIQKLMNKASGHYED